MGGVEHRTPREDLLNHPPRSKAAARRGGGLASGCRHPLEVLQALQGPAVRPLLARLLALFHRRRLDRDLSDEISAHLEFATAEHMARAISPEEALRAAMRRFGGVLQTEEAYRDRQGFPVIESMWQDVRYAGRSMRRSLAFASAAIVTLALGIGATTAIFNVVNGLLLRPLPFPDADRIVAVSANHLKEHLSRDSTSFLDFSDWQRQSHAFTDMAANAWL